MQFQTIIFTLAASVASLASAALSSEFINLWNGTSVTSSPIRSRGLLQSRNPCSGSAECTNDQWFKNACGVAVSRVDPGITYINGGS